MLFCVHIFLSVGFFLFNIYQQLEGMEAGQLGEEDQGMGEWEGRLVRTNSLISAWSFHFVEM